MMLEISPQVYIGNSIKNHLLHLEEICIAGSKDPYQNHIVLVPNQGLASYIWRSISKKYEAPLFSIQILSLEDGITALSTKDNFSLTRCIGAILGKLHAFCEQKDTSWALIEKIQQKSSLSMYHFAEVAALELMSYFLLRSGVSRIIDKDQLELIEILKEELLQDLPHLQQGIDLQTYPGDRIHLFGFSSLHPNLISLFLKLKATFYFISPCMMFWSDTYADKEIYKIANPILDESLIEELFWDRNPLLANFASVGKAFARYLEESIGQYNEEYFLPYQVAKHPFYKEYYRHEVMVETKEIGVSLLRLVQADLLTLSGKRNCKIPVAKEEVDLHIIKAKSKLEEVEYLLALLHKKAEDFSKETPLQAAFCLVYVSNISQYLPYIERVFSREGVQLQYQLYGCTERRQAGSLVQGFFSSLNLLNGRVTKDELLKILKCTAFQRKLGLSSEELQIILQYIEKSSLKSGYTSEQLVQVLRKKGIETIQQQMISGTWIEFEKEVVASWITAEKMDSNLDVTSIEIIAKWIERMSELFYDLALLREDNKSSFQQRILQLRAYLEKYFVIDFNVKEEKNDLDTLSLAMGGLLQSGSSHTASLVNLEEILLLLQAEVDQRNKKNSTIFSKEIVFAEVGTIHGHPADIVAYLGMDESSFSAGSPHVQDEFSSRMLIDDKSRIGQLYNYQFIEALILAEKSFIVAYSTTSPSKDREQRPAACVRQLIDMVYSGFDIEGSLLYELPCKYHYLRKQIDIFQSQEKIPKALPKAIDIRLLQEVAKNPIKAYLRHTLGIYIASDDEVNEAADLTVATFWNMRRLMLTANQQEYDQTVESMTHLPSGLIGKAHQAALKFEKKELDEICAGRQLSGEEFVWMQLLPNCKTLEYIDKHRIICPAIKVENKQTGQPIFITGTLGPIVKKNLLLLKKGTKEAIIAHYPDLLVLNCIEEQGLFFIKDGKTKELSIEDPKGKLADFVSFALRCLEEPILLLPSWIDLIVKGASASDLLEKANGSFGGKDPYIDYYLQRLEPLELEEKVTDLRDLVQEVYGELLQMDKKEVLDGV